MTTDPAADYAHGFEPPEMGPPEEDDANIREYIASGGTECPYCGSPDLDGGSVQIEGGTAWQPITCLGCDETWDDVYTLTGVDPN